MKILFKFPSRSRPEKFFSTLDNIFSNLENHKDFMISVTLDDNDHSMNNDSVKERLKQYELKGDNTPFVKPVWGHSRNKVHAVNRDIPMDYDWDILVLCSDDMVFIQRGFDELIRRDFVMEQSLDRVIHYRDGYDHGNIISLPVLGRQWYTDYGAIYSPAYISLFCDEELYIVAKALGKLYSSDHSIVKHQHPAWIGGEIDSQLKSSQSFWGIDHQTYEKRKRSNFFIK